VANDIDRGGPEHVVVGIGEGLRRSHDDRVSCVDSQRVEILQKVGQNCNEDDYFKLVIYLHVANGNAVVSAIPYNLVLDLLPALHTPLDENLWTRGKGFAAQRLQLAFILSKTGTKTTEGVGSPDDDRVSDCVGSGYGFLNVRGSPRLGTLLSDCGHCGCEELSILCRNDCFNRCAENADPKPGKFVLEFDADVEGSLTSEGDVDTIGTLVLDDLSHELWGDREEVDFVGESLGGGDGGNVGVDHDGINPFLLQSLDGLGTGIVEFSSLADRKTSRSENENLVDLCPRSPFLVLLLGTAWHGDGNGSTGDSTIEDVLDEHVEKELGVSWSGC
jgi:hypothetical protein